MRLRRFVDFSLPHGADTLFIRLLSIQYERGGYYLQDSIIMRGSFGPMGPAKAQLEALRQEQTKADQVRDSCGEALLLPPHANHAHVLS